jgi:dTDP-glucose pyrophosphorylase
MLTDLSSFTVSSTQTLREAMIQIGRNTKGIVLVVDGTRLRWVITDGDMRRAVLKGFSIDTLIEDWVAATYQGNKVPIVATTQTPQQELVRLMRQHGLLHLPILDDDGQLAGLSLLSEMVNEGELRLGAVIMAGGRGTRLQPTVRQLGNVGITEMSIATCYKADIIKQHFGAGDKFGVKIQYIDEELPLGTAGALGLMARPAHTQLVLNGDVLTSVDFRSMLNFHKDTSAVMTVGVRQYELQVPYGVVQTDGEEVQYLSEKPNYSFFVNAGIYLLEPEVYQHIPPHNRMDMPELIQRLIELRKKVVSFPVSEYWLDIGQHKDYEKAQCDVISHPSTRAQP